MELQGMTAVVTGASRGIGRAIALAVAKEGARVALVARSEDGLRETHRAITSAGGVAQAFKTDLRDENAINELAKGVKKAWGGADIVVNVAGVWHSDAWKTKPTDSGYWGKTLDVTDPQVINDVLDVGIRAPMLLTRLLLPEMIAKRSGKVLNISGSFFNGASGWLHYYVSKKAIESFTKGLAEELQVHKIQVNCISPSDTKTEPYLTLAYEDAQKGLEPEDIARFAVFLLSKEASHIQGQIITLRNCEDTTAYKFAQ